MQGQFAPPRARRRPRRTALAAACALALTAALTATAYGSATAAGHTTATARAAATPVYLNTAYSFQERAADLVSRMTLQEKVQQLATNTAPAVPRLGVQQYTYWSEGQHGVNTLGADQNNGGAQGGIHATSFPVNLASTMTWDPSLIYRETSAISDEVRGFNDKSLFGNGQNNLGPSADDYGALTFWAPNVNLDRDPRWGRTDEAFGEDPYLTGKMAGQFVDGYQGNDPNGRPRTGYLKVAATAKHYALNNVEENRTGISSGVDDTDLRDYYTAQFRSLIEDAHVSGLMTSYNAINGTPSVADTYTTNELAQRTYGFDGYITSDCGAVGTTWQQFPGGHDWAAPGWSTDHKPSPTWTSTTTGATMSGQAGGQAYALRAGTDLNCTGDEATTTNIQQAVDAGALSEGVLDNALVKVFTVRMETGEFDPASQVAYTKITKDRIESPAHQDLARTVADNSLVLLKNRHVSGTDKPLLPADPAKTNKIVILGDLANTTTLGGYSGEPTKQVDAVKGITDAVKAANPDASVVFDAAGTSSTATGAATLSAQTQADVKAADLVVVFVGTDENNASEGKDRANLDMPGNYGSLIDQATALGNKNTALVIQSDGPVKIDDVQDKAPAIVFSGYNGESQGDALADVLFGRQNPAGHLDFTWYKDASQLPDKSNYGLTPAATGGLGRTYQYFTGTPTYPFGYGLSYSSFAFSHIRTDKGSVSANGTVDVSVDVKNTGTTAGTTVAQLYAATPFTEPGVQLPAKRLEGFAKTKPLAPGATQHLTIPVKIPDLAFWDAKASRDTVYDGTYAFQVGPDAATTAGTAKVRVTGALQRKVQTVTVQPEDVVHNAGDTFSLTGKNKWIKDDTDPSQERRDLSVTADHVVEAVNNDESFTDLSTAHVTYSSSDPKVATVDRDGTVHAVADGTASIKVTVNGVSGTTPVVVRNTLALSSPPLADAGATFTARTTYTNGAASPVSGVTVALDAPSGWTATASSPATFSRVGAGQAVSTTWQVTVPAGTDPASFGLDATVTTPNGQQGAQAPVTVPYASVTAAYDNSGISDDATPGTGSLDGGGASFSEQTLEAAGYTAGQNATHDGITFPWPATAGTGKPDNIVASGQGVHLTGSGTKLGFIGTSDFGAASGSGTILYTDGTTQTYSLGFGDWWGTSAPQGSDFAATLPYLNNSGGHQTQQVHTYGATVPLKAGRTVEAVTLPNVSKTAANSQLALHIFSIAIGG
ncbi:glycoside hydrolase family 3 C-terminal domain-containing protein [Streptomyces sp. 8L]|uniref:glycoside hydrolase family 3 C-terminal domain-containing protein n=1 Tax=Streptomyces sp. 8L TaxID=2877242 RepID=UPI001CD4C876|nr:glycoside hydrolase family 3 C-terminal domain-containing protein [Streptomyces sp. 8L]MCA1219744.1 glycoside hydrolase family 3 C-terminal domain-containing protein [Streptomyces sp. 8L]